MSRIGVILKELRRRLMFRLVALYIVGAWAVLQVADLAFQTWGIPEHALRYVWIGALLVFPVALLFGWRYNLTPDGIVRTEPLHPGESVDLSLRRVDYIIITALIVTVGAIAFGLGDEILETGREHGFKIRDVPEQSIAVLPFANVGGDKATEPFTIGVHDDLLTQISKIGSIKTISRNSVLQYRNTTKTTPELAAELGVTTLLEGAVQRAGERVRINVQLIDAKTDSQLWAETYDRLLTATNIFEIQTGIATDIARSLQITLSPDEKNQLDAVPTENLAALEEYFLGKQQMEERTKCALAGAVKRFENALELDPDFVLPRTGLVLAHNLQTAYSDLSGPAAVSLMRPHVERALELGPGLAEVRTSKGAWHENRGELVAAENEYKRAIELNSNYALAYMWLGNVLINQQRLDEAAIVFRRAIELNPLYAPLKIQLGRIETYRGRLSAGLALADQAHALEPQNPLPYQQKSEWFRLYHCLDESLREARNAFELDPVGSQVIVRLAYAQMRKGDLAGVDRLMQDLSAIELAATTSEPADSAPLQTCEMDEQAVGSTGSDRVSWHIASLTADYHFAKGQYDELDRYARTLLPADLSDHSRDARMAYMWSGLARLLLADADSAARYLDIIYSDEMKYRFEPAMELKYRGLQALAHLLRGEYEKADHSFLKGLAGAETAYRHGWRTPDFLERAAAICALQDAGSGGVDGWQHLPKSGARIRKMCPLSQHSGPLAQNQAGTQFLRYLANHRPRQGAPDIERLRRIVVEWMENSKIRDAQCDGA